MHALKRTILVTGASSGIGLAVAEKLLQQGHTVLGIARRLNQILVEYSDFVPIAMDLTQLDVLTKKIKELQLAYPTIDAVIFCAVPDKRTVDIVGLQPVIRSGQGPYNRKPRVVRP